MRKISYLLLILMCALVKSNAQENLVLNPSFEKMNWCWCDKNYKNGCELLLQSLCSKYPYYLDVRDYRPTLSEFSNYTWSFASDSSQLNLTLWSKSPLAYGGYDFRYKNIYYGSGNGSTFDFTRPPFNTEKRKYQNVYAVVNLLNLALPISAEEKSIAGRTFLQSKLSKPLKKGCQYEFKVSVYPGVNYYFYKDIIYTTSSLGVAFTNDSVFYPNHKELIANHQADIENPSDRILNDTSDFMTVEGVYTAKGGERYLLLGNFKTNEQTVVYPKKIPNPYTFDPDDYYPIRLDYVIDDLSLTAIPPSHLQLNLGKDTLTCGKDQPLRLVAQQGFDSYVWNTGDTGRVLNVNKAGTYVVKADFGCGFLSDTIVVKAFVYKKNLLQIGELLQKCPEEQISLKAANGYANYIWSNGQIGTELSTAKADVYTLQATSTEGCIVKDTVQILNITAPQKVYLGKDTVICQGKSIVLDAGAQNAVNFVWNTGSNSQTIEAKETGNYSVAVSNKCFQVSGTINISTKDCSPIFIPNIFTPNGDGNNDVFKIRTEDNRTVTLDIYNRWGERLYHHASYQNQWNADGIPDGIYFYQIIDSEYNKTEKGWVQILR